MTSKLLVFICLVIICVPVIVFGQGGGADSGIANNPPPDFLPLVGIPGVTDAGNAGFGDYINALYRLSISLAALLAVIKIVAAGAKYMLSDIVTSKESAKSDIRGALLGLLIILGAFIILNTINTDITDNEFVIEDLKGADSSESRILRAQSRLAAAEAFCDANPSCTVKDYVDQAWCDARKGQFVPGQWMALGAATVRNRCFYDNSVFEYEEIACNTVYVDAMSPYQYDCTAAETECAAAGGKAVVSTANGTVTCATSCPAGQSMKPVIYENPRTGERTETGDTACQTI